MKIVLDYHTHTIASAHAYSTVMEMARAASERGLEMLGITDHAPALPDSSDKFHFLGYHTLPSTLYNVRMLYGAELNILDHEGHLDLPEDILRTMDICIASYHTVCTKPGLKEENTRAYLKAMENPYINVIGHPEDGNIPVDFEMLVCMAKKNNIMIEVNNSSLKSADYRINTRENLTKILRLCEKNEVYVCVGSDAHFADAVGGFDEASALLDELQFPEELVANSSVERFMELLEKRRRMYLGN